jgi:hypothetical protein
VTSQTELSEVRAGGWTAAAKCTCGCGFWQGPLASHAKVRPHLTQGHFTGALYGAIEFGTKYEGI